MRTAMLATVLALLSAATAVGQSPDKPPVCNPFLLAAPPDPEDTVAGCTYWIESGELDRKSEAGARMFRLIFRHDVADIPPAEILDEASKIIELDPRNGMAYLLRIESLSKLGQHERALQDVATYSGLFPDDPTASSMRSSIYSELGDHDRAISEARAAIKLAPGDWAAYHALVAACTAAGTAEQALADIDSGLALMKSAPMYALRSRVLRTAGRLEEARAAYEAAIQLIQNDDAFKKRMKQMSGEP